MAREKGDPASFEIAENESVAGIAEWRSDALIMNVGEAGHRIQPTASNDANFCLLQWFSWRTRGDIEKAPEAKPG
jgi:hypothetical protein